MQPMWPAPLSLQATTLLLQRGHVATFKPGAEIASQGAASKGLYIVLAGQAQVAVLSPSGRETIRTVLGPGEGYSFLHLYHPAPHSSSLVAREHCEVLTVPKQAWLEIADRCTELKDAVISIVTHRLRLALEAVEFNHSATGIARLAHRLLWHIRKTPAADAPDGATPPHFDVQLTQADLAKMLNLSRQRTSALLHQLEQQGVITLQYGGLRVHKLASLRAIIARHDTE